MKRFLLPLLALAPLTASARPANAAPKVSVDPAAKALIDIATAQYKAASGVRFDVAVFDVASTVNIRSAENANETTRSHVAFQRPNLLRVATTSTNRERSSVLLFDGKNRFIVRGKTFERSQQPEDAQRNWREALPSGTGFLMFTMLSGKPVLDELLKVSPASASGQTIVSAAPSTVVNGETLSGVRLSVSVDKPRKNSAVVYFWFGPDGLLRRVSSTSLSPQFRFQQTEVVSNQQLNPKFAPDTFKFDPTGLTPADGQ